MYLLILAVLALVTLAMAYSSVRFGTTYNKKRLMLVVLVGLLSFAAFGDSCGDSDPACKSITVLEDGTVRNADKCINGKVNSALSAGDRAVEGLRNGERSIITDLANLGKGQ